MSTNNDPVDPQDVPIVREELELEEEQMLPDSRYARPITKTWIDRVKDLGVYAYLLAAIFCFIPCLLAGTVVVWSVVDFSILDLLRRPKNNTDTQTFKNNVILISLDGFRHDYLELYADQAPTILGLANRGIRATRMNPIYPSLTFPNHYTIATGLYAESHGIVGNTMYDPKFNAVFRMGTSESYNTRWWQGEPIWNTAERQGVTSGCVFWVGSDVQINGMMPTYWRRYSDDFPNNERIDLLFSYFEKPERPARFTTMYFSDVDHEGHGYGPRSDQVKAAVKKVDDAIALLVQGLAVRGLLNKTDIVIVSDHGMTDVSPNRVIGLDQYINMNKVRVYSTGPIADIWVQNASDIDTIYQQLKNAPNMTIYKKQDLPPRYHYQNNIRIGDMIAVANIGYSVLRSRSQIFTLKGNHGFDNLESDMGATFVAAGPSFVSGKVIPSFDNVNVYPLLSYLLNIKPAPNNGTLEFWHKNAVFSKSKQLAPHSMLPHFDSLRA